MTEKERRDIIKNAMPPRGQFLPTEGIKNLNQQEIKTNEEKGNEETRSKRKSDFDWKVAKNYDRGTFES